MFLKKEVGAQAAVPREVVIIPQMPLTPAGKIFKPALRWDAIRRVKSSNSRFLRNKSSQSK
jgi:fatty-acyl-CoA synthase